MGCIESICKQTLLPEEVIIAHGGSDKETKLLIDKFNDSGLSNVRIRYFNFGPLGAAMQRNKGIDVALGEIIFFLDDDIVCERNFIKSIMEVFLADINHRVGGVSGIITNSSYTRLSKINKFFFDFSLGKNERGQCYSGKLIGPAVNFLPKDAPYCQQEVEWLYSGASAYRKEILKVFKFNEDFKGYSFMEDVDLSARIAKIYKLVNTTEARLSHKDLGRKTHRNWFVVGKMQVKNRWHVMINVLGKDKLSDKLRFFYYQFYCLISELCCLGNLVSIKNAIPRWAGRIYGLCVIELSEKSIIPFDGDVILSHSGKQHAYKVALALQNINRLAYFITSSYFCPDRFPDFLLKKLVFLRKFLEKRFEDNLHTAKVKRFIFFEFPELILRALTGNSKFASKAVYIRDTLFDKFIAGTQIKNCNIFWGFQGSCLESLKIANQKGIVSVVELSTAHIKTALDILSEEARVHPDWADSISNLYFPEWYINRLKDEPLIADYCIAASNFTINTLADSGISPNKILYLPLGVDIERFKFVKRQEKSYLQLLFVGGVGQRKGIKYLLEALKKINSINVKLKIVGPIMGSGKAMRKYSQYFEYLGIKSQDEIIRIMHESDCLVLPSLFEGFGLVILEAMATGMPVIASYNSAGPDIVREGIDGFIIRHNDIDSLVEKISLLASSKNIVLEMGENAAQRANDFSWHMYAIRVSKILNKIKK